VSATERVLALYCVILTLALLVTMRSVFASREDRAFDRITVHRIDVREPDGTLRMVISDHTLLPGIVVHGKARKFNRPQAGMLFYNDEASEIGGLIFGGHKNKRGEILDSGASLSFDRYGANQIVSLYGVDDSTDRFAGLAVADSPSGSIVHRRIWLGRGKDGVATLALMDGAGHKRLVLSVAPNGAPRIAVLSAEGKVVRTILGDQQP